MEDRDILLRLRRQYSKDETVSMLLQEIGVLKSEISELKDKIVDQQTMTDEAFIHLSKQDKKQYYVTSKRFNAQKKLTDYFIDLYHKEKDKNVIK